MKADRVGCSQGSRECAPGGSSGGQVTLHGSSPPVSRPLLRPQHALRLRTAQGASQNSMKSAAALASTQQTRSMAALPGIPASGTLECRSGLHPP